MNRSLLSFLMASAIGTGNLIGQEQQTTTWRGLLEVKDQTLRLEVVIRESHGEWTGNFYVNGKGGVDLDTIRLDDDRLRFSISKLGIRFDGALSDQGGVATGTLHEGDESKSLTLKAIEPETGKREDVRTGADSHGIASSERGERSEERQRRPEAYQPTRRQGGISQNADIPAEALEQLADRVRNMVENEEIVGGELLVIKNRRTLLRQAFGWKDREAGQPLEVDAVYCVRSMTKPLVGTAIQMLIDEGRLWLDTRVHEILPSFAGPETGKITIEHLLTHTGGFPFTTLSRPLSEYADLAAVAAEAASTELMFEPGARFEYSDAGSDTLGAVVAKIAGEPVERFIQRRILDPLGMRDSFTLLGGNERLRARIPSAYSGGTGAWSKHWEPSDPPLFPLFLGSQSLYATTTDYARFLALWIDGGRVGDQSLLSPEAVARGLAPSQPMSDYPANFPGLDVHYGQQWIVYAQPGEEGSPRSLLFGHDGSDGTHAWAWPELDLMVLFFTQSRGTLAGLSLTATLQKLLVDQELEGPSPATSAASGGALARLAGLYWDETNRAAYYVVTPFGKRLKVERPGKMSLIFKPGDLPGRFVHEARSDVWIEFTSAEDGSVTGMRTCFGGPIEHDPRHVPREGLPTVSEVIALVKQAHRIDRLPDLGVVRLSGSLKFETRGMEGTVTTYFDAARERVEVQIGGLRDIVVIDGGRAWTYATPTGVDELAGARLEEALLNRIPVLYGDWTEHYESVEVLKRIQAGGRSVLLVRVVPREAPGSTIFVDEASGRVLRVDSISQIPGLGIVGVRTRHADFREVGGMLLPFRSVSDFASPLLGRVGTTLDKAETRVEAPRETFTAPSGGD